MKFNIQEVPVYFPYPFMYPEQYKYMCHLKRSLDVNGHCLLEVTDALLLIRDHSLWCGSADAYRNGKDDRTALLHHFLSTRTA